MRIVALKAKRLGAETGAAQLPLADLTRYGLAVLSVAAALGTSLLLQHFHFRVPSALLLLFAVAISSWYAGLGPAALAVVLSTIGFYWYFVEPVRTISISWSQIPYLIIFAAFAALLSWFGTVRRRAEEALRERADLLNLTHDTIFVMDMEGVIQYWNRGAEERYGWTAKQAVDRIVHDLLKTVFPAPLEQIKAEVVRAGSWEGELVHTRQDGSQLVVASRWALRRDKVGAPFTILETNNDITARKRAEEELRRSEGYLVDAQSLAHTGAYAMNGTSREPTYWSEEMFRLFGFEPKEGLPTREQVWQQIHPEDFDKVKEASDRTFLEKVAFDSEYRLVLPDGTVRHVHAVGRPVLGGTAEVVEVVATMVDLTERKRAEEERERLRHVEAELAHINRVSMMGELSASIAHEVNQPLSGIVSNGSACLRWLAGDPPNLEEVREAVGDIVRDGKRAGEVIARIRALTRRTAPPKEELDLNETIRDVLILVGDEAKRKGVMIGTRFADDLFPILGDRVQLQQVVLNLVMNAIEAMSSVSERARQLVITTRNIDPDQVQVTVEDSGNGLDPNTIGRIFDPFFTTKSGGMGMGLSISRSILQNHGGRLWATANNGPGTTFQFTLPKYHAGTPDARVAEV